MKKFAKLTCGALLALALLLSVLSVPAFAVEKTLTTDKTTYTEGDPILVTATGEGKDWVGIFKKGEVPGSGVDSIYWYYVDQEDAASGDTTDLRKTRLNDSRTADADLPAGEYTVYLLENDGYTVLAKVEITITAKTVDPQPVEKTLTTDKTTYTEGDPILVTATGEGTDWVGIFKKGEVPGDVDSIYWYYVAKEGTASGDTKNLRETKLNDNRKADADLPAGEYTVYLLENDGYTELAKVEITITAKTVNPPATGDQGLTLALLAVTAGLTALAVGRRVSRKRG